MLANAALERMAEDVIALDVRGLTSLADTFLIASGTSDRHVRAIADAVLDAARAAGIRTLGVEGYAEGRWVLLDLGDAIFHVFHADVRGHYDLERLWTDAPQLEIEPAGHAAQGEGMSRGPVMLVVLDGFGIGDGGPADATAVAHAPFFARLAASSRWRSSRPPARPSASRPDRWATPKSAT